MCFDFGMHFLSACSKICKIKKMNPRNNVFFTPWPLRLCHQIAHCNTLVNTDKSDYYNKLISDNSHNSRKLWHKLHKTLNRISEVTLPSTSLTSHWRTRLLPFCRLKLRKLEILLFPQALKMIFILLQILKNHCLYSNF